MAPRTNIKSGTKNGGRSHYIGLYLLAQECDSGGLLIQNDENLTVDDLSILLHTNSESLENSIRILKDANVVSLNDSNGLFITSFIEEQGPTGFGEKAEKEREKWKLQKQHQRENKKSNSLIKESYLNKEEELNLNIEKDLNKDIDIDIEVHQMSTVDNKRTTEVSEPIKTPEFDEKAYAEAEAKLPF